MRRLILFLVRCKLGLKKHETFRFTNQRSLTDFYFFDKDGLMKVIPEDGIIEPSHVSLNWLLDDRCKIKKRIGV